VRVREREREREERGTREREESAETKGNGVGWFPIATPLSLVTTLKGVQGYRKRTERGHAIAHTRAWGRGTHVR